METHKNARHGLALAVAAARGLASAVGLPAAEAKSSSAPSGITVGHDHSIYVSNCGICAGDGEVLRFNQVS